MNPRDIRPKASSETTDLPFDTIDLPSRGLLYKSGPLAGNGTVEVFYLTATHEDILTSPNLLQSGKMVDTLLNAVIKNRDVKAEELLLGDRNAILVWLRSTGYGSEYPVKIRCKNCAETYTHEFDLSELNLKTLDEEPDSDGYFSFTLPMSKKAIRFKFLTGKDETEVSDLMASKKSKNVGGIDSSNTEKLCRMIVEIDGNQDPMHIRTFVRSMRAGDSKAFKKYVNQIEPGIIMRQDAKCSSCGNIAEEVVPITPNFFWPDFEL